MARSFLCVYASGSTHTLFKSEWADPVTFGLTHLAIDSVTQWVNPLAPRSRNRMDQNTSASVNIQQSVVFATTEQPSQQTLENLRAFGRH